MLLVYVTLIPQKRHDRQKNALEIKCALCKLIIEEKLKVVKTDSQEDFGILIINLKRIHSVSRQNNFFGAP